MLLKLFIVPLLLLPLVTVCALPNHGSLQKRRNRFRSVDLKGNHRPYFPNQTFSTFTFTSTRIQRKIFILEKGVNARRHKRDIQVPITLFTQVLFDCYVSGDCPTWTPWFGENRCSASCGGGTRTLRRYCENQTITRGCPGNDTRHEQCNTHTCPMWSNWSVASRCSKSCGEGRMLRTRFCTEGFTVVAGCNGPMFSIITCTLSNRCDAHWSTWGAFGNCSKTCGGGIKERTRICVVQENETIGCSGLSSHKKACNTQRCLLNTSSWSTWSNCDVGCGEWKEVNRTRSCVVGTCQNEKFEDKKICLNSTCTEEQHNLTYNTQLHVGNNTSLTTGTLLWSSWSVCSVSCGPAGIQRRARGCRRNGSNLLQIVCDNRYTQIRPCVPPVTCPRWVWSTWSPCTKTCGRSGTRTRNQQCVTWEVELGVNANSSIHMTETVPNSENMCSSFTQLPAEVSQCSSSSPCYPHWNKWGPWNQCSNSCGVGVSIKRRVCTLRGRCMGESIKYKTCSSAPCWSEWSPYSPCSTSCNGGVRTRDRICSAGNLHSTCNGSAFQSNVCNTQVCPLWTAWSNYGECSTTCGKGFRHRSRSCLQGNCDNRLTLESVSCNLRFFCPTWSPWSVYSCCSVSCGIGTQTRERTCYHGQVGEIGCIGPLNDTIICNIDCHNQTQHAVSRNMEQCGLRVAASSNRRSSLILKIFGGNISRRNSWPWQASLQEYFYSPLFNYSNWLHFCGGTIVSSQWVITAAHCLQQRMKNEYSIEKFSAVLGLFRLNLQHNTQRIGFKRTFIHSDFQRAYFTYKNDVALIQLDRKLQWTSNIRPACLPGGEEPSETESCYITGWGRTRTNSSELSSELRESIIPILSNKQCRQLGSGYNTINMTLHLCAGDPVLGGRDTCQGDSGGPIICNRSGIWYVAGITSHSLAFCGARNNVGIYMRTTGYETWIHDVMTRYNRPGC